jgi:hypothetical protein
MVGSGQGPTATCLANRGITSTSIHSGQVTVPAHPRKSPQVQARCYTRVRYAISGPGKRSQQGSSPTVTGADPVHPSQLSNGVPSRLIAARRPDSKDYE